MVYNIPLSVIWRDIFYLLFLLWYLSQILTSSQRLWIDSSISSSTLLAFRSNVTNVIIKF
jgi:hypothetical protein